MDIPYGLRAVSEALNITKELRNIDDKMDASELKLRIIDVTDGLMDAKAALNDAKIRQQELEQEIRELKGALAAEASTVEVDGFTYKLRPDEKKDGPFCHPCHENSGKLFRLEPGEFLGSHGFVCPNCEKIKYTSRSQRPTMARSDYDPLED